jgi:hypothetical protein
MAQPGFPVRLDDVLKVGPDVWTLVAARPAALGERTLAEFQSRFVTEYDCRRYSDETRDIVANTVRNRTR